jgi:small subunit ribosomal protein S19e
MTTLYDVPAEALIDALAEELDERIDAPDWADVATTGVHAELPPEQPDFWPTRAASILRKVAAEEPVGVSALATEYGGKTDGTNRYRVAPNRRTDGSRKIVRTILHQLEDEGFVQVADGEGRVVTAEGRSFIDGIAADVLTDLDRPELERYA